MFIADTFYIVLLYRSKMRKMSPSIDPESSEDACGEDVKQKIYHFQIDNAAADSYRLFFR
jgi:hypothetical protein